MAPPTTCRGARCGDLGDDGVRGQRPLDPRTPRTDGDRRLDAVRTGRVRDAVGAARFRPSERPPHHARAGAPARRREADRGAVHQSGRAGRVGRLARPRARPTSSRPRSSMRSTSSRGIRAVSARALRCDASTISTRSTPSTATRARRRWLRANVAASRAFVAACERNSGDLLPYVSTAATVRDIDAIRAAIGEEQISYVGFSYGTLLGADVRRPVPQARARDGARRRRRPRSLLCRQHARPGDELRRRPRPRSSPTAVVIPDARSRAAPIPRRRTTTSRATIAQEPIPATVDGRVAHARAR